MADFLHLKASTGFFCDLFRTFLKWAIFLIWLFIWLWCLCAIWYIFHVQNVDEKIFTTTKETGMMTQFRTQNFKIVTIQQKIHTAIMAIVMRHTVIVLLYRKWSVKARSRSTEAAPRMIKDTLEVIHPQKNSIIRKLQYALNFLRLSATL